MTDLFGKNPLCMVMMTMMEHDDGYDGHDGHTGHDGHDSHDGDDYRIKGPFGSCFYIGLMMASLIASFGVKHIIFSF